MRDIACIERSENIAFIEDDPTIQKILKGLGLWETLSYPAPSPIYKEIVYVDESSTPVPV